MKCLSLIIIGLASIFFSVSCYGQNAEFSQFFTILPDQPDPDKGARHYKRNAKRSFDRAKYGNASLYAIEWLRAEERERRKKKAYEFLQEALPKSLAGLENEISTLEADTASLEGRPLLDRLREIKKYYLTLEEIKSRHQGLTEKWKVKKAAFRQDYQSALQPVNHQLRTVIVQLAESHYQKAQHLIEQGPENRQDYIQIAKAFRQCRLYLPTYKDVENLYPEFKQKATARMAILPVHNKTNYDQLFTTEMQKSLHSRLQRKLKDKPFEFFQLVPLEFSEAPEKRNLAFQLEIMNLQVQKKINEPTEDTRERAVANEKTKTEKVIKGVFITYSKEARVSIEAKYTITDLESKEVLATEAVVTRDLTVWSHSWYTCRGNCDALKKRERRLVKDHGKDKPFPSNLKLAQSAIANTTFHNRLTSQIIPFAQAQGQ